MDYSEWEPCEAVYLDDLRPKPEDTFCFRWILLKNYQEFTAYIRQRGVPKFISFDHDLALEHYAAPEFWDDAYNAWQATQDFSERTGYDCAKWLVGYCMDNDILLPHTTCHSANPSGAANIIALLNNFSIHQRQEPTCYRTFW